jgi:hypothetical protein
VVALPGLPPRCRESDFLPRKFGSFQVGESVFYRHQIYRYRVKEMENTAQALKEARAMIATLKKVRRKAKAKI